MRDRKCAVCGKMFPPTGKYELYCQECSPKAVKNTLIRPRTCAVCGIEFDGFPRAKYCPDCRIAVRRERDREFRKRGGAVRKIGSIDHCQKCGAEYKVASGLQKYCENCANEAIAENISKHKREYNALHSEEFKSRYKALRAESFVCVVCGKTLTVEENTRGSYCCPECREEYDRLSQNIADIKRGRRKSPPEYRRADNGIPKSGIVGVTWNSRLSKWSAQYKGKYLGVYKTIEEAAKAIDQQK